MTLSYVLIYAILGSIGAVSAAALILLLKENWVRRIVPQPLFQDL